MPQQYRDAIISSDQEEKPFMFLASWLGHMKWADSRNLIQSLEVQL